MGNSHHTPPAIIATAEPREGVADWLKGPVRDASECKVKGYISGHVEQVESALSFRRWLTDPNLDPELRSILLDPKLTAQAKRQAIDQSRNKLESRLDHLGKERRRIERLHGGLDEVINWAEKPAILEKLGTSCLHHLLREIERGSVSYCTELMPEKPEHQKPAEFSVSFANEQNTFVIQHDWAAAFKSAQDFADGPFLLPFETCVFEFKISGKKVLVFCRQDQEAPNTITMLPHIATAYGWFAGSLVTQTPEEGLIWDRGNGDKYESFIGIIFDQIRAVAIALDAGVVIREPIRASADQNARLEKRGEPILRDYHIVSLARRSRTAPMPTISERTHKSPRLHFRRGHWRHFSDHKTWIKWMLVGDPNLGFVEKEYRL